MAQLKELLEVFQGIAKGDIPPTGLIMLLVTIVILFFMFRKPKSERKKKAPDPIKELIRKMEAAEKKGDHQAYFRYVSQLADANHSQYIWELGKCHLTGKGTRKDTRKAIELFDAEIEKHSFPTDMYDYANMLYAGTDLPMDRPRALALYSQAARKDHPDSCWRLWQLHQLDGVDTGFSEDDLAWFLFIAAVHNRGDAREIYWHRDIISRAKSARYYMRHKDAPPDSDEALRFLRLSAAYGDNDGIIKLGYKYTHMGFLQALQGERFLEFSADHGSSDAMYILGYIYAEENSGLIRTSEDAIKWFTKAAKLGHADAANRVAVYWAKQMPLAKKENYSMVYGWYNRAIELGSKEAMYNMSIRYHRGAKYLPKDPDKARDLMRRAAELGLEEAKRDLKLFWGETIDE